MSLLRTAARASVATRVIGNTHRRQQQKWAAQDSASSTAPPPVPAAAAPAAPVPAVPAASASPARATSELIDQLTRLGELRDAGILTDAEFDAQKQRLLAA
ncbi:SHOCT domain-containing protein [Microbacterium phyllosphaerae]|uniref:SHOCT domain-containing protein n=1 Tax=Microbacterium phyllosphaerae TaxID=124798 RepID=UPI003D65EAD1